MTAPSLSTAELARMLRALAERVESGADVFEISMESEKVGHATKTTITLWSLPEGRFVVSNGQTWCSAWRADIAPSKRCQTFLRPDGTCPNAERHMR